MAVVPSIPTSVAGELLERDGGYAVLENAWAAAQTGEGRLVLVSGDAGIGKSAVVRGFCARVGDEARVLSGACDGLWTPRPLGPLADMAAIVGGGFGDAVAAGVAAPAVFEAFVRELRSTRSTVVVFEDVHIAD